MIPNAKQEKAPRHEEYKRYELSVDRPGTYINNAADKHRWVQLISSTDNRSFKSQSIISLAYHSIPGQQAQPMYMMTTCMLLCKRLPFHSNLSAFQTRVYCSQSHLHVEFFCACLAVYLQTCGDDVLGHNSIAKEVHWGSKDVAGRSIS